jgi:O-antigen/teichoic acid export membrane protein
VYGAVGLLVGAATLGRLALCAPVLQAALRFYPDAARSGDLAGLRRVSRGLLLRAAALLAVVIFAAAVGAGGPLRLSWPASALLAALVAVDAARTFEVNLLNAARLQRPFALWSAAEFWVRPALALAAIAALGATAEAVLLGYVLGAAGLYLSVRAATGAAGLAPEGGGDVPEMRRAILRYAAPLVPLALASWITSLSDRYFIAAWLGTAPVGVYAAAYGLGSAPFLMAQAAIELSLRPAYFDAVSAGDRAGERRTFRLWLASTAAVGGLGTAAVLLWRDAITRLALAAGYREAAGLLPWIASGYALMALATVFEKPCYAHKRTGWVLAIQAAGAAACLASVPALIRLRGLRGAAMAVPVYFGVQLAVAVYASRAARRGASAGGGDPARNPGQNGASSAAVSADAGWASSRSTRGHSRRMWSVHEYPTAFTRA